MDELSRHVLCVFDGLEQETLDLHALLEFAGGNDQARRDEIVLLIDDLVRKGYIEPTGGGDIYSRTEEGRLAVADSTDVTLYSRPKCHLCDQARETITPVLREFRLPLREVNIDEDPELRELYTNDVPVIFLGSKEFARHHVDAAKFKKALERAAT